MQGIAEKNHQLLWNARYVSTYGLYQRVSYPKIRHFNTQPVSVRNKRGCGFVAMLP